MPPEDDTRRVHLTPKDIERLLKACQDKGYAELATLIRLALQTSADRGVLLEGKSSTKECTGLRVETFASIAETRTVHTSVRST